MTRRFLPLSGTRVLVSRPEHQSAELVQRLTDSGAEVLAIPAVEVTAPLAWEEVDAAIYQLSEYDFVIFTSVNGVNFFVDRAEQIEQNITISSTTTVVAIGPATAGALARSGIQVNLMPEEYISDRISELLGDVFGKKILLPRADIARRQLPETLINAGADVTELTAYRVKANRSPEFVATIEAISEDKAPDYITVTSPSTARGISILLTDCGKAHWLHNSQFVCIGPITADAVKALGFTPHIVAEVYTSEGIFNAILQEINNV